MLDFVAVRQFIRDAKSASTEHGLKETIARVTRDLGFDFFALVQHVDLARQTSGRIVAMWTYPPSWVREYLERGLVSSDPVHLASHRTNVGFSWDEVPSLIRVTAGHRQVRRDTVAAGIGGGFTVPANIPGEANGSCSFALASGKNLERKVFPAAQLVGSFAFQAARSLVLSRLGPLQSSPTLTPRQLECLVLVGRGKTDGEIATILGIAEDTVTEHLDEARRRYDVVKRTQAVVRAMFDGQIAMSDIVR